MSAVILRFPREATLRVGLTTDQVLSRCNTAAITSGCNNAQKAAVRLQAEMDLGAGIFSQHQIIQRAKSLATTLAYRPDPEHGPDAA